MRGTDDINRRTDALMLLGGSGMNMAMQLAKPRLIHQVLGKRPILAAGNSNGDLHMLQYVANQERKSLSLLVHHTDETREYR